MHAAEVELTTTGIAKGGEAVARDEGGRVVFVRGALPGETVRVELTQEKKKFARGHTVEVLEPSPHRVAEACPEVAKGCGGCDMRHTSPAHQLELKHQIVTDLLTRTAKLDELPPIDIVELPAEAYRTTVRVGTIGGRASYFIRGTKHLLPVDGCPVAHPLVEELIVDGRFGVAADVMIRVGARTGDRMVVVGPTADDVHVPDDVLVVGVDELKARKRAWVTEEAGGNTFRISARSFFQARPDGADALVEAVHRHLGPIAETDTIADLYGGVGLFAASMPKAAPITLVETSPSAVADAKFNLPDHNVRVVKTKAEKWTPDRTDIVIADPSREGLHPQAVQRISQTRSDRVVLVSCDPAAMARDVGELGTYGLKLQALTMVDLFPQTSHIETVASFSR